MAIQTNYLFKGILITDAYIKINRLNAIGIAIVSLIFIVAIIKGKKMEDLPITISTPPIKIFSERSFLNFKVN